MIEPAEVIERYLRAYEAATGTRVYGVTYERGWFTLQSGTFSKRLRRSAIEEMTARLERRVKAAN